MRGHTRLALVGLAFCLLLLGSCGGGKGASQTRLPELESTNSQAGGLPELSALDRVRGPAAVEDSRVPVTEPIAQLHTQVSGENLVFLPTAQEYAYAVYRIERPGTPLALRGIGAGPLWLLVADYGTETWEITPFEDGQAEFDLTELGNPLSPEGYTYVAVVCIAGCVGFLESLTLEYDNLDWGLAVSVDEHSITLDWNELEAEGYRVYRSTLSDDSAPYLVGTTIEEHNGGNTFTEYVNEDPSGRWVAASADNGTPDDTTDDFPTIAPAVDYYYRLEADVPGLNYPPSPEVRAKVPWGGRYTTRRIWPDTTSESLLFGRMIDGGYLSEAQLQWCGENLVGSAGLLQSEVDAIRAYNPDFIALGANYSIFAAPERQCDWAWRHEDGLHSLTRMYLLYGDTEDLDGNYPYVDAHENWFIHHPDSELYHHRVEGQWSTEPLYWMNLDSRWSDYLGPSMHEILGEDCFDGWQVDGSHGAIRLPSSDFIGVPGYQGVFDYLQPRLTALLGNVDQLAEAHPRHPYIIAGAYRGWGPYESAPDGWAIMDYPSCDGVMVTSFMYNDGISASENIHLFDLGEGDAILDLQNQGKMVFLQSYHPVSDTPYVQGLEYCCYLLLRGPHTYFYYLPDYLWDDYFDFASPCWYPEFSWDSGAPLGDQPESLDDLLVGGAHSYWRRDFENGFVLVVSYNFTASSDPEDLRSYEYLAFEGGGMVDADGNTSGTATWTPLPGPGFEIEGPAACILRPVQ